MRVHLLSRHLGGIVLSLALAGCSSWQVQDVAPAQLFENGPPERLRITRGDSTQVVMDQPRLGTDSLVGVSAGAPVAIPLTDVRALAVRKGDTGKTLGLIAGVTAAGLIVSAAAMHDCCGPSGLGY